MPITQKDTALAELRGAASYQQLQRLFQGMVQTAENGSDAVDTTMIEADIFKPLWWDLVRSPEYQSHWQWLVINDMLDPHEHYEAAAVKELDRFRSEFSERCRKRCYSDALTSKDIMSSKEELPNEEDSVVHQPHINVPPAIIDTNTATDVALDVNDTCEQAILNPSTDNLIVLQPPKGLVPPLSESVLPIARSLRRSVKVQAQNDQKMRLHMLSHQTLP